MNPQHIVYLSLVLVGIGVTLSALDPLKQEPISLSSDWVATGLSGSMYYQHYYNDDGKMLYSCISEIRLIQDECKAQQSFSSVRKN